MDFGVIVIGIAIFIIAIFIYVIKNFKDFIELIEKLRRKKIFIILFWILFILMIIFLCKTIYDNIISIPQSINSYKSAQESEKMFYSYDEKIKNQNKYYKELVNKEYPDEIYKNPYIPNGFEYVEGDWNTGYVIQDENKNQYVWVPCTNKEGEDVIKLDKYNFENPAFISKDLCSNQNCEKFLKSALENGGFYISRFEIGKEDNKPVSRFGIQVWSDITQKEAIDIINNMYKDKENFNCELINGYAYDTTLMWLKQNNEIDLIDDKLPEKTEEIKTGRNSYNNIFDLTDNIIELTLETSYDTVIVRGVADKEEYKDSSRYSILEDENFFDINSVLCFRTVIYK